jgi:hypothetical protein
MMTMLSNKLVEAKESEYSYYTAGQVSGPVPCYRTLKALDIPITEEAEKSYQKAVDTYLKKEIQESCLLTTNDLSGRFASFYIEVFRNIYFYEQDISAKQFRSFKTRCTTSLNKEMRSVAYGRYKNGYSILEVAKNPFLRYVMGDKWTKKYYKRGKQLDK